MRVTSGSSRKHLTASRGFTLVELLVVIGIIAILIGILLPSLSRARQSAQQVKCAASLQAIGQGYMLYATEYDGFWPPFTLVPNAAAYPKGYTIGDDTFTTKRMYWYNFVGPQIAAPAGLGNATTNANQAAAARQRNVIWGCPAFDGYIRNAIGGANPADPGFGATGWPLYKADDPNYDPIGTPGGTEQNGPNGEESGGISYDNTGKQSGRWFKQTDYTYPADRGLVGDANLYVWESTKPIPNGNGALPENVGQQVAVGASNLWNTPNQTTIALFRHGAPPPTTGAGSGTVYLDTGGRIGYNLLYCDGHVAQQSTGAEAYRAQRMRFPN